MKLKVSTPERKKCAFDFDLKRKIRMFETLKTKSYSENNLKEKRVNLFVVSRLFPVITFYCAPWVLG